MIVKQHGFSLLEIAITLAIMGITVVGMLQINAFKQDKWRDNQARHQANILLIDVANLLQSLRFANTPLTNGVYLNQQGDMQGPYQQDNNRIGANGTRLSIAEMRGKYCQNSVCADLQEQADFDLANLYPRLAKLSNATFSITCTDANNTDDLPCSLGSVHHLVLSWQNAQGAEQNIKLDIRH